VTRWKVYKLDMERKIEKGMVPKDDQWRFAKRYGVRDYVEASLRLLISQQCNGFLFALKSNLESRANELRVTSGRLHHPFIALNQGEIYTLHYWCFSFALCRMYQMVHHGSSSQQMMP